jgi:hypothetical protein
MEALNYYVQIGDLHGQWRVSDDLVRLWLVWAECAEDHAARTKCFEAALEASIGAAIVAARLWRDRADDYPASLPVPSRDEARVTIDGLLPRAAADLLHAVLPQTRLLADVVWRIEDFVRR